MTKEEIDRTRTLFVDLLKAVAPNGGDQVQVIVHLMAILAVHQNYPEPAIDELCELAKQHLPTLAKREAVN